MANIPPFLCNINKYPAAYIIIAILTSTIVPRLYQTIHLT
uniref:G-protein coupled receptors family 1 profile domain-containing protein n=1 Tax=Anguilla anguilla TaxID=7936 RepID=A0A0E9V4Q3_ANGAN